MKQQREPWAEQLEMMIWTCYVQRADVETENLPSSHSEVRDSVVVGFEDFGIVENFISESV